MTRNFKYGLTGVLIDIELYGIIEGIGQTANCIPEDTVYTSGISDIYPADILVAKVISVNKDNNKPFQDIIVEILSDLDNLDYVFIIQ